MKCPFSTESNSELLHLSHQYFLFLSVKFVDMLVMDGRIWIKWQTRTDWLTLMCISFAQTTASRDQINCWKYHSEITYWENVPSFISYILVEILWVNIQLQLDPEKPEDCLTFSWWVPVCSSDCFTVVTQHLSFCQSTTRKTSDKMRLE